MSQLIDLGKLRFYFAGDWDVSTTYELNDIVKYGGNIYVYTYGLKTSSHVPTDTSYWALMVEGFKFQGVYDNAIDYRIGDGVTHGGKVYICILDTTGNTPPNDTYWSQFADGIQWEGEYDNTQAYQKNDIVSYGGNSLYIAKQDTTAHLPSDTTYWAKFIEGISSQGVYNNATAYVKNDVVAYGGNLYRATGDTTGNLPSNTSYWEEFVGGIKARGAYVATTEYALNDVVNYGGIIYRALTETVGNLPTNVNFWEPYIIGSDYKGSYDAATAYVPNDVVSYGGNLYTATTETTGNLPSDNTYWDIYVSGVRPLGDYDGTANYVLNDVVSYGGSLYRAIQDSTGNLPTDNLYWEVYQSGVKPTGAWATSTAYYPGDLVVYGGNTFRALLAHGSTTFATDLAASKWEKFNGGIDWKGMWSTSTFYKVDDVVKNNVSSYICLEDHSSGTFATDYAAAKWMEFAKGGDYVLPDASDGGSNLFMSSDGVNYTWREVTMDKNLVRIMAGSNNNTNAYFREYLQKDDTYTVMIDNGTAFTNDKSYIYFDNAYEGTTGTISISVHEGTAPAGISTSVSTDGADTGWGNSRIYGTPSAEGIVTYKINYNDAYEDFNVYHKVIVAPAGTTPVFQTKLPDRIIRNTAGSQTLTGAVTTSYAGAVFSLSNVTGFATGVTPVIDAATGEVTVSNIGDIDQTASAHSYTINCDLGPVYGTITQTITGDIAYGDPYGARYFGPANADRNLTSSQDYSADVATSEAVCNPAKSSGALARVYDVQYDTSPYLSGDGYGCKFYGQIVNYLTDTYADNLTTAYVKNGVLGNSYTSTRVWASASNFGYAKFKWQVPAGVTKIAAVAVGGGSMGTYTWASDGGGGGGLAWMNGVTVTPGETFTVFVGLGRACESTNSSYGAGSSFIVRDSDGVCLLFAQGGGYTGYTSSTPNGRTIQGVAITGINFWDKGDGYGYNDQRDGGGYGVNTSLATAVNGFTYGGGVGGRTTDRMGAGAGGYRGNTPAGANSQDGYYGGGGNGYDYSSTYGYGAGGGVGLDGQGARGSRADATPRNNTQAGSGWGGNNGSPTSYNGGSSNYYGGGGGGSGGTRGSWGENPWTGREEGSSGNYVRVGGFHGGGGGGSGTSYGGGHGAPGGVRIIWGIGADGVTERSFPYTYCSENPNMMYNGEA